MLGSLSSGARGVPEKSSHISIVMREPADPLTSYVCVGSSLEKRSGAKGRGVLAWGIHRLTLNPDPDLRLEDP